MKTDEVETYLEEVPRRELVIQKNGQIRQAGSSQAEGAEIAKRRSLCESNLYYFLRTILDYHWLSPKLHVPVCKWVQTCPPRRKFLLMPRGHCKSTIVAQGLPLHMVIQPASSNIYFPGEPGCASTILIVGEKLERAQDHLRASQDRLGGNALLRAFWPQVCWEKPKRDAKRWNDTEMMVPGAADMANPTFRASGIGGATTGLHPKALIFDDLTTEAAANSPTEMQNAIGWSRRATALLFSQEKGLIWYTGTRWAVADLPDWHSENSPEIQFNTEWRTMVQDGEVIFPEAFGYEGCIEELQRIHGVMFPLLYMNSIGDSTLTDFSASDLRYFTQVGDQIEFEENDLDVELREQMNQPLAKPQAEDLRGRKLDSQTYALMRMRNFRVRSGL